MSDERCFCGAVWVDEREECADGHGFGEADKFRIRAEKAEARVKVLEAALRTIADTFVDCRGCMAHAGVATTALIGGPS